MTDATTLPGTARFDSPLSATRRAPSGAIFVRLGENRWHFQHGPIDLILGVFGQPAIINIALNEAWQEFSQILVTLTQELHALRRADFHQRRFDGAVANRMKAACLPFHQHFITPMAAVAGSVADAIITCFQRVGIDRAFVNNGGDIAWVVAPQQSLSFAIASAGGAGGTMQFSDADTCRGLATSGWAGRSFSLGIADAVTVVGDNAAIADASATLIANAVNVQSEAVKRRPANELDEDSDLGSRLVTMGVADLLNSEVDAALDNGVRCAKEFLDRAPIDGVRMELQGQIRTVVRAGKRYLAGNN